MRPNPTRPNPHKGLLLLTTLAFTGSAFAQVAGSGVITTLPSGTTSGTGANPTTVIVNGPQSIVDWTPTNAPVGGVIDFLPAGNTLDFVGDAPGYIVLNRFTGSSGTPITDQIAINGTINSRAGSVSGLRGGNIWFYNAGGILIGSSGVLNVGSLVLTSNDIDVVGGLNPGGTIRFRGSNGNVAPITVNGAINASNDGNSGSSYVALVSPRIVQAGAVRVDGSAAYVAAEQADIAINSGLFDINVLVGAQGGNAIVHTGSTTGPAHEQGDTDQNRIYMVAIPKNDAVTMLVSGQVGYDDAVSAQTDSEGAVILSAGYNISDGEVTGSPLTAAAANISIDATIFRSDTSARASGAIVAQPQGTVSPSPPGTPPGNMLPPQSLIAVEGNGFFVGDRSVSLSLSTGQSLDVAGSLTIQSGGRVGVPGDTSVTVSGGRLTVGGGLTITAAGETNPVTETIQGGTANLTVNDGTVDVTNGILVEADGGNDLDSPFGDGRGGTATIDLLGGTINATDIRASAIGYGGTGSTGNDADPANIIPGGPGGLGMGGSASITIDGTADVTVNDISADATGTGGMGGFFTNQFSFDGVPGTPGVGGEGVGGTAVINVNGGTLTAANNVIADASGIGGSGGSSYFSSSSGSNIGVGTGGTGGTGRGGNATVSLSTPIADGNLINSIARGLGGEGGSHNVGGDGGEGRGGDAQIIVTGFNAGTLAVIVDAVGQGGDGGQANDGNGGNGGQGFGGVARSLVQGIEGRLAVLDGYFRTDGFGGNGGNGAISSQSNAPPVGPRGGNGGRGTGGTMELVARDQSSLLIDTDGVIAGLSSGGTGGNGGAGASNFNGGIGGNGGDGGAGTGGSVNLIADGGTITSDGRSVAVEVAGTSGSGGPGGAGSSSDGSQGALSTTTGGNVLFQTIGGPNGGGITLGATEIAASGDSAGRVVFRGDGAITMDSLSIVVAGEAPPTNNNLDTGTAGIFFAPTGDGSITTLADMELTTDSSIGIYAQGGGTVEAQGSMTLNAGDQVDIRHSARAGSTPTISAAGDVSITAGRTVNSATGTLIAASNLTIDGATGITGDRMTATGTTRLNSADGNIAINALLSSEPIDASGNAISIGGDNMVFANLTTDVGDAIVSGNELFVINGNVAGRAALTSTGEQLTVDTLTAGSADLRATNGALLLQGNVTTTGALTAEAEASILVNGIVIGSSVSLASSDIEIGAAARIGAEQTVSVRNNDAARQTFVGGTGTRDGFHVDAEELTRLFGTNIEVVAPARLAGGGGSTGAAIPPDVIIDTFTMTGGSSNANIGANGSLTIRTPGRMRVIGNVQLTGLANDNGLNLFADNAIEVILGQGSIRLLNGSNPAGRLTLASSDVIVATPAAMTDIGTASTTRAINTRLGENDGVTLDAGALFARGMTVSVARGFYVQNSGTGTDPGQRRGLTFGEGGLAISTGSAAPRIVINGVYLGPNGQITGLDTIPFLTIMPQSNGRPGNIDPRSTLNGCLISNPLACNTGNVDFEDPFPVQDVIEEEVNGDEDERNGNDLPTPLITIREIDALIGEPLLDDPVTGAGNDDLWAAPSE